MSVLNFSLLRIFQGYLVICCLIINVLCFCCLATSILDYHISFRLSTTFLFFWDSFFCHSFLSVRTSVVFAASLSDECYSIMPLSNCQYFLYFLFYLYNWHNLSSHSYHFLSTFLKRLTWNKIFALIRHSCSFYPICYCKGYVNTSRQTHEWINYEHPVRIFWYNS